MAKKRGLCVVCRAEGHDQCPLVKGCSCCKNTSEQMQEENFDDFDIPTEENLVPSED